MSLKSNPLVVLLTVCLILTAAGCKNDSANSSTSKNIAPVAVKFQGVTAQIHLAGVIGAISQNYFKDENLEFELLFSDDNITDPLSVISQVTNGEVDFGLTPAENLLLARERGDDVVALMSIYQRDPSAIISLDRKNITTPEDLRGKTLLVFNRPSSLILFLNSVGIDASEVTTIEPPNGDVNTGITMFLTGQVDGIVATGTDAAAQMQAIGMQPNLIYFYEYGIEMYPNVIFTTQRMIDEQPDVVQRFVNGVLRGLQYAIDQPEALATWFVEHYGDLLNPTQLGSQGEAMQAIIPLIQSSTSKPGMMSPDVWDNITTQLASIGIIQNPATATDAYDVRFVEAYYR